MSDQQNYGFGKFVPGFDFLQNLAKGASQSSSQAGMSSLSNWVAPTLNVEELDKRISELKAVNFWLDQNSRALAATIQALELQKMTLATLRGMNFNMTEIADALKLKPADAAAGGEPAESEKADDDASGSVAGAAKEAVAKARASRKKAEDEKAQGEQARDEKAQKDGKSGQEARQTSGVVDPLQWWGALTQQFQEIAAGAMREAANNPAIGVAREMASGVTQQAVKAANDMAVATAGNGGPKSGGASKKAGAGKSAARKTARKSPTRSR